MPNSRWSGRFAVAYDFIRCADRVYTLLQVKDGGSVLFIYEKNFYKSLINQGAAEKAGQADKEKSLL